MLKRVLSTIKKYKLIDIGENVVVGVSGGPDSVCLLHVLNALKDELDIKIFAYHLNHMLRGEESNDDEKYVLELCGRIGIPLKKESFDIREISKQKGVSLEEAGRDTRYLRMGIFANETEACKISVAHNRNDQAETVLLHILRGTGLNGLTGMDYKRGRIIRPLLDINRNEIEEYCIRNALAPRTDSSNLLNVYTRNKIRLDVIPYIDKLFRGSITESLFRMSSLIKDDSEYMEEVSYNAYKQCLVKKDNGEIRIDIEKTKDFHPALIKRIVRFAIQDVSGDLKGIESIHTEAVVELILNGRTGSKICLPFGLCAEKSYNTLKIFIFSKKRKETLEYDYNIQTPGITLCKSLKSTIVATLIEKQKDPLINFSTTQSSMTQFFDYEKIKEGINIRSRKTGDNFKPLKSNGTKKLKEYFIDLKIPREIRDMIPVIVKDKEVVWLVGYKTSDKFKVTENTKSILKLEYRENEL